VIRAAVFDGPGKPFRLEAFPRPALGPGEALVRVRLCTVCGSDLHTVSGRRPGPTPCVLGHEAVGVVEEVNGALRDVAGEAVRVGDRVVWAVVVSCGSCFFCRNGLPQKCESLRKYGHEPITSGVGPLSGLATHAHLLPGAGVVKVPAGLPDEVAAPAMCATATVMAVFEASGGCEPPGEDNRGVHTPRSPGSVVVFGLGMLGLTACATAAADGTPHVIACDVDDTRLSLARRFGATHAVKPAGVVEAAKAVTAGRGADVALELSGSPAAAALSLDVLRVGGFAAWAGAVLPTPAVPVDPEMVVRRCLTVAGVHNYAPWHLHNAVNFLAKNHARFPFAELVSRAFDLDDVDAAFRYAESERPVRVAVRC
jgi:alcohol dehydrogenase